MIWLQKWQQSLLVVLLVGLVWSSGLVNNTHTGQEQLGGWWLAQEQQSGHGHLQSRWVERQVRVPLWLVQGRSWVAMVAWLGLILSLVWPLWGERGTFWSYAVVVYASHRVVAEWKRLAELRRLAQAELAWQMKHEEVISTSQAAEMEQPAPAEPQAGLETTEKSVKAGSTPQSAQSPALEMGRMLAELVERQPIGTNLGLLQFMWMLVSGQLLSSRGAIFPALQQTGLAEAEARRVWAAFAKGKWQISDLLNQWQQQVEAEGQWQEHCLSGYRVKAIDLVGFWRPELQCSQTTPHFKGEAGKALPAIVLGVVTRVGQVGNQRVPLPTGLVRVDPDNPSEATLTTKLLREVANNLAKDELAVFDAGFDLAELLEVGLERFVVRMARNATARRNNPPEYKGYGRHPEWGEIVRPLARTYKGKRLEATSPDREASWQVESKGQQLQLTAHFWDNLVLTSQKPGGKTFNLVAIHDPRYNNPLLLATSLKLDGPTLKAIYADRWTVEHLPLSAKQMLGAARQFVHATESVQRLPELSLLAGAILTYVAAKLPPIPTGFWDRTPKSTPGRLRRVLTGQPFPPNLPLPARIRRKASVTGHLPKGILAHRRQKRSG